MHLKQKICKLNRVLGYKIDLYFHDHKLAIEDDDKGHISYEMERQKAVEKELGCEFIINPDEENFNIFKAENEIYRRIKKSTKKSLIDKISKTIRTRI